MAFDIATSTGVAWGSAGGTPRCVSVDLGKGRSEGSRFSKMLDLADHFLKSYKPDIVVYEAPIGGAMKVVLPGQLAACFVGQAVRLGYEPKSVDLSSVRKHFLGKNLTKAHFPDLSKGQARTAIKRAVIARCLVLGWDVKNDDQGDACATWDYACATMANAQSIPHGGLFNA